MNEKTLKPQAARPVQWFWHQISRDALSVGVATWLVLILLEIIKPGIASNYLSLTRFALALVLLVFAHMFLRNPQPVAPLPRPFTRRDLSVLVAVSLLAVLLLITFMPRFDLLTLLVISVTVLAIWIGSFLYAET